MPPKEKTNRKSKPAKHNVLMQKSSSADKSLLIVIVDCSPVIWGERDLQRSASDKKRLPKKRSMGPATLEELLISLQVFMGAYSTLQRQSALIVIGVSAQQTACLYPRKDVLELYFQQQGSASGGAAAKPLSHSLVHLKKHFREGAAELVAKCASASGQTSTDEACMAAGVSMGLAMANRFLVTNQRGVSALTNTGLFRGSSNDGGSVAGVASSNTPRHAAPTVAHWSPRLFVVQASPDRAQDYNAMMNAVFCSKKLNVTWDACFLSGSKGDSSILQQACDLTGGVYLSPTGAAQVGTALTEVLMSVFLPSLESRQLLNLPSVRAVDFRAQAFDSAELVDMAFVCNQCLSIYKKCPKEYCPTCGADIKQQKANGESQKKANGDGGAKRRKFA